MSTQPTDAAIDPDVEGAHSHEGAHVAGANDNTGTATGEVFFCNDCGRPFSRTEAARPAADNPGTCTECYRKHRMEAKAQREVEKATSKKTGRTDRYTFSLDPYTSIAIDTLAVGRDRSTVVEQAIALMLASDPAAKAFVEHRLSQSQR